MMWTGGVRGWMWTSPFWWTEMKLVITVPDPGRKCQDIAHARACPPPATRTPIQAVDFVLDCHLNLRPPHIPSLYSYHLGTTHLFLAVTVSPGIAPTIIEISSSRSLSSFIRNLALHRRHQRYLISSFSRQEYRRRYAYTQAKSTQRREELHTLPAHLGR